MPFYKKFFGYKHSEPIQINSIRYGRFSYQYRGQLSALELATVFQAQPLLLYHQDAGTVSSNIKVEVKLYSGTRAMDFLYSDDDILDHYDDDSRITCVLKDCSFAQPWQTAYPNLSHAPLFTNSTHPTLEEMLAARKLKLNTSVAVDGLQM